ncbi:MAG: CPBP family intramembrane metalloprotease [Xanthomonadales bacterium]|nr:CPBP family intramembrane metalloprotease [Xanthomonadales bacterium]
MRIEAGAMRRKAGGRGRVSGAELRWRLHWWLKACRGLAAVIVSLLLSGLVMTSLGSAPYVVFIDLVPATGSAPVDRLSELVENELKRLGADEAIVVTSAPGDGVETGACGGTLLTARFHLSRGDASAFFRSLPALSERAGAPICGWGYRQETDILTLRTLAVASGMPIIALALAILLVRGGGSSRRRLIGTLPGVGPALWMGTQTGALCLLLPLLVVPAMVRLGVPVDTAGDVRTWGLEELAWLTVILVLCAPLVEEYAFRMRFLGAARKAVGPGSALVLSALAFAAFHLPGTIGMWSIYWAIGMVLGLLWLRSRSLLACCTAHASYNATLLAWSIWVRSGT